MVNWDYTPYNKEADEALKALKEFDSSPVYQDNINKILDYIYRLEDSIFGYTE